LLPESYKKLANYAASAVESNWLVQGIKDGYFKKIWNVEVVGETVLKLLKS